MGPGAAPRQYKTPPKKPTSPVARTLPQRVRPRPRRLPGACAELQQALDAPPKPGAKAAPLDRQPAEPRPPRQPLSQRHEALGQDAGTVVYDEAHFVGRRFAGRTQLPPRPPRQRMPPQHAHARLANRCQAGSPAARCATSCANTASCCGGSNSASNPAGSTSVGRRIPNATGTRSPSAANTRTGRRKPRRPASAATRRRIASSHGTARRRNARKRRPAQKQPAQQHNGSQGPDRRRPPDNARHVYLGRVGSLHPACVCHGLSAVLGLLAFATFASAESNRRPSLAIDASGNGRSAIRHGRDGHGNDFVACRYLRFASGTAVANVCGLSDSLTAGMAVAYGSSAREAAANECTSPRPVPVHSTNGNAKSASVQTCHTVRCQAAARTKRWTTPSDPRPRQRPRSTPGTSPSTDRTQGAGSVACRVSAYRLSHNPRSTAILAVPTQAGSLCYGTERPLRPTGPFAVACVARSTSPGGPVRRG